MTVVAVESEARRAQNWPGAAGFNAVWLAVAGRCGHMRLRVAASLVRNLAKTAVAVSLPDCAHTALLFAFSWTSCACIPSNSSWRAHAEADVSRAT
eukprot:6197796-Pleurochrysis_carterae.AAC.2